MKARKPKSQRKSTKPKYPALGGVHPQTAMLAAGFIYGLAHGKFTRPFNTMEREILTAGAKALKWSALMHWPTPKNHEHALPTLL